MFEASTQYLHGKRFLQTWSGADAERFCVKFRWQTVATGADPGVWLNWYTRRVPHTVAPGFTRNVKAGMDLEGRVGASYAYVNERRWVHRVQVKAVVGIPVPKLKETLSLARSVAAGKAPPQALFDWIMQEWPHPWSLLTSDRPIRLVQFFSPLPLDGVDL